MSQPTPGVSGRPSPRDAASKSPAAGEVYGNSQNMKSDSHVQTNKSMGKKKRHRGGRRRRQRRPSFAGPLPLEGQHDEERGQGQSPAHQSPSQHVEAAGTTATSPVESRQGPPRNLGQLTRNLSESSLDSQELLDHRYT